MVERWRRRARLTFEYRTGSSRGIGAATGLGTAQVRARVASLAKKVLGKIAAVQTPGPISEAVVALIAERCERFHGMFSRM